MVSPDDLTLASNLIIAYRILGEMPNALAVAKECMGHASSTSGLAVTIAKIAIDADDEQLIEQITPLLSNSAEAIVLKFSIYYTNRNWEKLVGLRTEIKDDIPPDGTYYDLDGNSLSRSRTRKN